jgi:hypothetical protein
MVTLAGFETGRNSDPATNETEYPIHRDLHGASTGVVPQMRLKQHRTTKAPIA